MNSNLRAIAIAEWRGLPEPKQRADRYQSTSDVLTKIMQRLGATRRAELVATALGLGLIPTES